MNERALHIESSVILLLWLVSCSIGAPSSGAPAIQQVEIKLGPNGDGQFICEAGNFPCLGRAGVPYPKDITITTADKHGTHISHEFNNAVMPFAILIWGKRGIYIHEWSYCTRGGGESEGCIHLCKGDAEKVYKSIRGKTRIRISYPWH